MAALVSSGALLLVLLSGVSYGYPAKKGYDDGSFYPGSAGGPSSDVVILNGHFSGPVGAGASVPAAAPSSSNFAPHGHFGGALAAQPGVLGGDDHDIPFPSAFASPVSGGSGSVHFGALAAQPGGGLYDSDHDIPFPSAFASPVSGGSGSAHFGGVPAAHPGAVHVSSDHDIPFPWAVAPPSPFSGGEGARRPSSVRMEAGYSHQPHSSGSLAGSPAVSPAVSPALQGGELSQYHSNYEEGIMDTETEDLSFNAANSPASAAAPAASAAVLPSGLGSGGALSPYPDPHHYPYPHYDYMFLTGQYPPGTVSHASSSFEQGADSWDAAHYIREYIPVVQVAVQQQSVKQPPAPVKQAAMPTKRMQSVKG